MALVMYCSTTTFNIWRDSRCAVKFEFHPESGKQPVVSVVTTLLKLFFLWCFGQLPNSFRCYNLAYADLHVAEENNGDAVMLLNVDDSVFNHIWI